MRTSGNSLKFITSVMSIALAVMATTICGLVTASAAEAGFAFDVYGDSRSMMYLPYKKSEEARARELMVDMFELVLPAKISQEMVDKYVKLTYDPANNELVQIVMPFMTA